MNVTVVFCESAADVAASQALRAGGARLVALTPAAWMAADAAGAPCAMLEDFYSEHALAEMREPVLAAQLAWMDRLDAELHRAVPALATLRMARLWFYCLKRLIDPLTVMAFAAGSALDRLRPGEIVLPRAPQPRHDWPAFFRVGPHGRMDVPHYAITAVAAAAAAARGIRVSYLDAGEDGPAPAPARARGGARALFRRHAPPWLLDASTLVRKFGLAGARHLVASGRGTKLLVVRGGYDLDLVVDGVAGEYSVDFWSTMEARARLTAADRDAVAEARAGCAAAWAAMADAAWLREPFASGGLDTLAFATDGLRYFVTETVPESLAYHLRARALIRARGYGAVLAPAAMRATSILAAARAERVPVFIYQHGGFVGTCEHLIWDFCDFAHADVLVTYGEGERRYFERRRARYAERRADVVAAGSARLAQLTAAPANGGVRAAIGAPAGARIVLYASTMTSGYSRMIAAESYPETRGFVNQVRALEVMKEFPDVTFVFKPYSDRDDRAIREMIARRGVTNCRVIADVPLFHLMRASDAILVEFPSTALLEAVMTDKPVAVLVDRESLRIEPDAEAQLRRRAIVAGTFEEFEAGMRALAAGAPAADTGSGAYAREYALDPSVPALPAALEALRRVIESRAS